MPSLISLVLMKVHVRDACAECRADQSLQSFAGGAPFGKIPEQTAMLI